MNTPTGSTSSSVSRLCFCCASARCVSMMGVTSWKTPTTNASSPASVSRKSTFTKRVTRSPRGFFTMSWTLLTERRSRNATATGLSS